MYKLKYLCMSVLLFQYVLYAVAKVIYVVGTFKAVVHCEQNQFKKFASFGSVLAQFSSTKPGYKTCHFLI